MDLSDCIHGEHATRYYLDRPVPADLVQCILQAGRASGSGKNTQLWHFIVVDDREQLTRLAATGGHSGHLAQAALGIVIVTAQNPYVAPIAYFDAGRAAQNMLLMAHALGVGACPVGFRTDPDTATALLQVPSDKEVVLGIALGYADTARIAEEAAFRQRVLVQQGRRPLADMCSYNRFGSPYTL